MGLYKRNYMHSLSEYAVGIELENKPNLEDLINILLQNGYWVRLDFESETSSIDKVRVWIAEERG